MLLLAMCRTAGLSFVTFHEQAHQRIPFVVAKLLEFHKQDIIQFPGIHFFQERFGGLVCSATHGNQEISSRRSPFQVF